MLASDYTSRVSQEELIGSAVRRLIQDRFRLPLEHDLSDSVSLAGGGLFLDSIALVELVMACEDELGVSIAGDFLEKDSVTVGTLIAAVRGATVSK